MAWRLMMTSLVVVLAVASATAQESDAITAARFSITVDGYEVASFADMGPLDTASKWSTITLKRGISSSPALTAWHEAARQAGGRSGRKDAVLIAYDRAGKAVARYRLTNAWPSKIHIGGRGGSDGRRAETVALVCERIQRVAP